MKALYVTQKVHVLLDDIRYLQADTNYTIIHTNQDESIISSTTIKRLNEKIESNDFLRINKKYVLNKKFIKAYNDLDSSVMLDDGQTFLLSRRKNRTLRAELNQI
ncbi:LytR/AlgR family response regulator transcription factor [Emticicia sp. SJ17W-69]|uniref:LytR/AlgR family response regulator transcription factor n=1 Tax=Emticicia sp. SJ17W-69 TaxID=3421657 RepID=UPI003EBDB2F7